MKATPLIKRLLAAVTTENLDAVAALRKSSILEYRIRVYNKSLTDIPPFLAMIGDDYTLISVGATWLQKNLTKEEVSEVVSLRLLGELK